jgi:hypothetical protein
MANNKKVEEIVKEIEELDNKKEEIKEEKIENKQVKAYMLVIQFFLSIITLVFVILFLFKKNVLAPLQISLALTLFVMGINNILVYKRKFFTLVYLVIGLALLVLAVLTILGV